jgi:hypothetical protein
MRLIVSHIVLDMLKRMDVHYPKVSKAREEALQAMRSALEADR